MFSPYGLNLQRDLQNEVNGYMKQHEPPMEHQLYRLFTSLSNELIEQTNNLQDMDFLCSSDQNKRRYLIILPCKKLSSNLLDMVDQIMAKFNYKRHSNFYSQELKEYHLNYKI